MVIHFMTPKDLVVQYQKTPSKPPFYKTAVKKECLLPFPNLFVKGKVRGCSNVSHGHGTTCSCTCFYLGDLYCFTHHGNQ